MTSHTTEASDQTAATRRCGRCRADFPIDSDEFPAGLDEWWACPACDETLLPGRRRPTRR